MSSLISFFIRSMPRSKLDYRNSYNRPGINRISLKLQSRPRSGTAANATAPVPSDQKVLPAPRRPEELFDQNNMPLESVYTPLMDTFFATMSQHFPSVSRRRMAERLETGTMSAFMMNCEHTISYQFNHSMSFLLGICAVGARFAPPPSDLLSF